MPTKEIVIQKIKEVPERFAQLAAEYQDDFSCAYAAIVQSPKLIRYASERLRDDDELALLALNLDASTWIYISNRLKEKYREYCPFIIHIHHSTAQLQMSI